MYASCLLLFVAHHVFFFLCFQNDMQKAKRTMMPMMREVKRRRNMGYMSVLRYPFFVFEILFFLHLSLMPFLFDILLFKKRLAPWTNTAGRKHGHTKQKSKSGGWRSWRRKGDETDKERRAGGNSKSLSGRELHHLIMGFAQSTAVVALNFPVRIWGGGVNNRWFLFLGA